jgi:hypothetical protein
MGTITLTAINSAIEAALAAATGLTYSQDYNELTEGMQDIPTLQVYWFSGPKTDPTSGSAQTTFGAGVRQKSITFHADLYARQRSHIGEDMAALLPLVDAIHNVLESQQKPYFGLAGIKAIESWDPRQVIFEYGDQQINYVGARFVIQVRVF